MTKVRDGTRAGKAQRRRKADRPPTHDERDLEAERRAWWARCESEGRRLFPKSTPQEWRRAFAPLVRSLEPLPVIACESAARQTRFLHLLRAAYLASRFDEPMMTRKRDDGRVGRAALFCESLETSEKREERKRGREVGRVRLVSSLTKRVSDEQIDILIGAFGPNRVAWKAIGPVLCDLGLLEVPDDESGDAATEPVRVAWEKYIRRVRRAAGLARRRRAREQDERERSERRSQNLARPVSRGTTAT